ncbi:MAG TPA: hypothetical protein PLJ69_07540 [Methanothrix sp.]|jgi:hypothetical protein|nr:MAG: hypothetical protein A4E50_00981 [Methanosaeta sp. PtaB.Bin087]OPY53219.1 MAG: hypothetical protein A4E51_01179 [Methanosaeta sp. PtaU1.Bin055]HNR58319.1 hypothetical protein [Methanothrix sp.]HNT72103.1 hypothetical protein [Methanothrix sp.]HOI70527.1 hypothetical protein [Methanothrix sp.]
MGLVKGFIMKVRVLLPLAVLATILSMPAVLADWSYTEDVTDHSYVHLSGYIDEMKIYQTDRGFHGQKLVVGTKGSGMIDRRQTAYVYDDEVYGDEMYFNEWGTFDHRSVQDGTGESDLRNALCAKNYEMGTVISESYTNMDYLIKDTTIYQNDNVSIYQIASEGRGTARLGARVKDGPCKGVTIMTYGGTYIGDFNIRQEIGSGDELYLTCP